MTPVDPAPPALWAFLYPWCRLLRGKLHLEGRTAENSARWEYHWVAVRLPHSPENADVIALRRIREALDLLARVAIVDNAAWRAILVHQCRVPRDEDDQPLDCALDPRFRFVFNEKFVEPGALSSAAVCKQFFVTVSAQRESDDYLEARRSLKKLQTALGKTGRSVEAVKPIPFELQFELLTLPDEILETHLRDLNTMLGILQANGRGDTNSSGLLPLGLDSIRLDVGGVNMSWSLTQRLTSLLSSGLPFSLFAFSLKKATAENYVQMQESVGWFLRTVLCGLGRVGQSLADAERGGVDTLSVGCHDCDEWQFAALCSALGSASVTKHLRLYGIFGMADTEETRRWKWQWLTYALFRTATESTVERALITAAQLTREDTLAIAVAIHVNSPPTDGLSKITREEIMLNIRDWGRDNVGHFLDGTEFMLIDPDQENDGGGRLSSIFLETDSWLHIVSDGGDHFDVVLPGFGIVRADKLPIEQRLAPTDNSTLGLKALTLALGRHFGDDGGEVLTDFLNLIGTPLRSLALYAVGSYPISMASISQACPQLTDLFLEGIQLINPRDFSLDIERTKAKLKCLGLVNVFTSNEHITHLAEAIASPSSQIAQHLSELGLSGSEASCTIDDANVRALLTMLKTNRKLMYLSLGMSPELQTKYDEAIQQHHGESLPVVQNKVPIPAKTAFLSAVRGQEYQSSASNSLDDAVLSLILALAATCASRTVTIHYDD
ncbi:hypothetical protein PC119_g8283 [Phytophthora cactorum]|uniref:Uncharacterized protein n=1 Tax=Phytophthora cactorum TaxID=29920 RepID=A0A8T1D5Z8_9STRA|nr:hypothetical protein PC117_g12675 [Phytophthora cactorum]KAG3024992.1 hypothetical protein PC119_g8283 [Phytophthora cactorum]